MIGGCGCLPDRNGRVRAPGRHLVPCVSMAALVAGGLLGVASEQQRRFNMGFDGQMQSAIEELQRKIDADPDLRGRKVRLGKFTSSSDLPDSRFEQQFERTFRRYAVTMLDDTSDFFVSGHYDYVPATAADNRGLRVVQIVIEVKNAQRRVLQTVIREINNSGDIARIVGIAVAPPDSGDVDARNEVVRQAHDKPSFRLRDGCRVQAASSADYALEIRARSGGVGEPRSICPRDVGGRPFFDLGVGDTFEIVLYNFAKDTDAVASVTIDGLDVIGEFCVDATEPGTSAYDGYVVPRGGSAVVIPGWLRTTKREPGNVLAFTVNEYGKGAASARASRGTRGVINVQFFEAVPKGEELPARAFGGEVGAGRPLDVAYETKAMTRRDNPIVNIAVHYNEAP